MGALVSAFIDPVFILRVKDELPKLFKEARREAEALSNLMTVGLFRKKKIIMLLTQYYGYNRVKTTFSSRIYGRDVEIDKRAISIKTVSNSNDVKIKWTVDSDRADLVMKDYVPLYDLLIARVNWDMRAIFQPSGLFFIPKDTQRNILQTLGRENYLKPPTPNRNTRGVSLTREAFENLLIDNNTIHIDIDWSNW